MQVFTNKHFFMGKEKCGKYEGKRGIWGSITHIPRI